MTFYTDTTRWFAIAFRWENDHRKPVLFFSTYVTRLGLTYSHLIQYSSTGKNVLTIERIYVDCMQPLRNHYFLIVFEVTPEI